MDSYVHCHNHSTYSLLDGAAKIAPLFAEAERLGMAAVAITDHGNMFGAAEAYRESQKSPVTWIAGIEAYVAPTSRHHKQPVFWGHSGQRGSDQYGEGGDVSGAGAYTHMTMLAQNATGLRNLFRLSSLASIEGYYYKPRMDKELIAQYSSGIIATTGCPSGEVQTRLRLGQRAEALQAASDYRDIFGADNFFVELMDHGLAIERSVREGLLEIGRQLGLRLLATNDSHYVTRDQAPAHDALLCVQTASKLADKDRFRFEGDGYYLKSADEMRAYWDNEVPGACDNTLLVAGRIESYDEVFAPVDRKPRVPLEPGDTEDAALRRAVNLGVARQFPGGMPAGYQERLDTELGIIAGQRFASYFLVVDDLMTWAKSQGFSCRCRGSAAGSLVLFVMQITDLDPMVHGLFFERFLNPDRVSPPDIDIDVEERHREAMARYLSNRWGAENVAQVITFGTIKTKAAIKDATRILDHPYSAGEKLTKALPAAIYAQDVPLSAITDTAHERYGECAGIRTMIASDSQAAEIIDTARGIEGLIRNAGVHACGVFLSSEPLIDVLPLWAHSDDGSIITGWDWSSCEDVGLLKLDVLGSDTLSVITDTIAAVEAGRGVTIKLPEIGLDDPAVYNLLASGNALGVFQMEGAGARDLLRRIRPTCFADICAATALYRPGPMGTGTHYEYAARKHGHSPLTPIHPELAKPLSDVLSDTYGLCCYQEDVMSIARKVAGYTLAQADLLRRAMGKKKPEVLLAEFARFRDGMAANGYSAAATEALWDTMLPFSSYAFVRSHAASYGLVSYWTAYLKVYYPTEFMAARLSSVTEKVRIAIYLAECRRMKIPVLPPDVNTSGLGFTATPDGIRFGLSSIRNVGEGSAQAVIDARRSGSFTSFTDFLSRVDLHRCTKRTIESLIKAGAFDSLGHHRQPLAESLSAAVNAAMARKAQKVIGQGSLFDDEPTPAAELALSGPEWPQDVFLAHEREMLGLYVSAHPLDDARQALRHHAPRSVGELLLDPPGEGERVTVAGLIAAVDSKATKQGKRWAIVTLEDVDGRVEVRFLSRAYTDIGHLLVRDAIVAVTGKVADGEGELRILGDTLTVVDLTAIGELAVPAEPFLLALNAVDCTRDRITRLREVLERHPGRSEMRVRLTDKRGDTLLALADELRVTSSDALAKDLRDLLWATGAYASMDDAERT